MTASKRRLGRGLEALLGGGPRDEAEAVPGAAVPAGPLELAVDALRPGPFQPRQAMSEESLAELADSIRAQGLIQPLVVRPCASTQPDPAAYEIVAGERRWRAARMAGLATVPVIVRELDDQSALAVALIENLQREDLNPIEQARSMARLADEFEMTHQQVAEAVGRSRSSVTNLLRLLDLHDDVKTLLASGRIDMGHARALLSLEPEQQIAMARKVEAGGWSVRQVERASKAPAAGAPEGRRAEIDAQSRWLQRQIAAELGRDVALRPRNDGSYRMELAFRDLEQLHDALGRALKLVGRIRAAAGPRVRDAGE